MRALGLALLMAAGCGSGGSAGDGGVSGRHDAAPDRDDGGGMEDGGGGDDGGGDHDAEVPDAEVPDAEPPPDADPELEDHVHILIDNFCNTSAEPESYTVPAGQTLQLTYHNHSVDYDADVWLSYGGGYLGLVPGDSWADQFRFCATPEPYTAYADISIAGGGGDVCPGFRLLIHCE
jgi:hypothetical protein